MRVSVSAQSTRLALSTAAMLVVAAGQTVEVPVASGTHSIVVKVDWCGSPTRHVTIDAGETVLFECGSNLRGVRVLLAIVYVLFLLDGYLTLDQV